VPDPDGIARFVGLTSTIPVEIVFAAGLTPLDLNNLFITAERPETLIHQAEADGFAHNVCVWIKGIYAVVCLRGIQRVIAVTGGDCSSTVALGEVLASRGVEVIPFHYPSDRRRESILVALESLKSALSASWPEVARVKQRLDPIRRKLRELDRLTFEENLVTGGENHRFLVNSSDFSADPDRFESELETFLELARKRSPLTEEVRLGFLGVPSVYDGVYEFVESLGGRVVFNEVQRQFSMPYEEDDLATQYLRYTYPYEVNGRIEDIRSAVRERNLDGLIHYTQTFCFRQIHDILMRKYLPVPILTLEGDRPGPLDGRSATRIETFVEMLRERRPRR
jgi:benzoyl-CoA reductase/2-hydroxyglutaryl-CoA dehydratase subunit BcrC/BadD/HgdB